MSKYRVGGGIKKEGESLRVEEGIEVIRKGGEEGIKTGVPKCKTISGLKEARGITERSEDHGRLAFEIFVL